MSDTFHASAGKPLTDRFGFLASQIGFYAAARFSERLAPLDLQPRHFGLLTHIAQADGQTQQHLADLMGLHRNAMVGLLDDLEGRGLVQRRRHPADRRAHAVHLTAQARALLTKAQQAADLHDTELLTMLDPAERDRLIELLQRVAAGTALRAGVHPALR